MIVLVCLGWLVASCLSAPTTPPAEVLPLKSANDYFALLSKNDLALIGFYDSERCPDCAGQLQSVFATLLEFAPVRDFEIKLALADFLTVPFLKTHLSFERDSNLLIAVKNHLVFYRDFWELVDRAVESEKNEGFLLDRCQFFITNRLEQIVKRLYSLANLAAALAEKKVIGVFMGGSENDVKGFFRFAALHPDFSFFHISDRALISEVFQKYGKALPAGGSVFAVLRDAAVLAEYDNEAIVLTDNLADSAWLAKFFDFERYPKLRGDNFVHSTTFNLFANQDKMLLYVGYDSAKTQNLQEFRKAVKVLPRRLIYTYTYANSQGMGYYMHLFQMAGMTVTVETVYLLHILPSRKIEILTMHKALTRENIVNFMFEFYESNRGALLEDGILENKHTYTYKPAQDVTFVYVPEL